MTDAELNDRLAALGLALPPVPKPVASYVPAKLANGVIHVSGQLPMVDGQLIATGPVPQSTSLDDATKAARQCVLNGLAAALSVGEPTGVVRVGVFVFAPDDFTDHPKVANGASDLLVELFGDPGRHARAAVGCSSLPLGVSVEVEMTFETA